MIFCTLIQNDDVRIKQNTLGIIVQKVFCSSKSKIYFSDNRCWASGSFDNFFLCKVIWKYPKFKGICNKDTTLITTVYNRLQYSYFKHILYHQVLGNRKRFYGLITNYI